MPVLDELVIKLEDDPQRNREQRQKGELRGVAGQPRRSTSGANEAVDEKDVPAPCDRRVPRIERLHLGQHASLGRQHDEHARNAVEWETHLCRRSYVSRSLYEAQRSAGLPTPLPKMRTLCVLPSPPGSSSVFSASRRCSAAEEKSSVAMIRSFSPSPSMK